MLNMMRNKTLTPIFLLTFSSLLSHTITSAVEVLFALDLGATYLDLGLISLFQGVIGMLIRIPLGILSDKFGRKPMLFLAEFVIFLSSIVRCFAMQPWHLIVAGFIGGFSGGAFMPLIISLIGDKTEPTQRANAISTHFLFSSLGMFLGPSIASLLLLALSIRALLYISTAIRFGILILIVLGVQESGARKTATVQNLSYRESIMQLLKKKNMLLALNTRLAYSFFQSVFRTYVPVLARLELGLSNVLIASLGTFQGIARIGIRVFLSRFIHQLSIKRLYLIILGICCAVGFTLPFANSFHYLAIVACFYGLYHGIDSPLSALLVADVSTTTERGFANSLLYSAMYIGTFTPILIAPIAEGWGVTMVFPFGSILPIIALINVARFMEPLLTTKAKDPS
jgi:MFS family permease